MPGLGGQTWGTEEPHESQDSIGLSKGSNEIICRSYYILIVFIFNQYQLGSFSLFFSPSDKLFNIVLQNVYLVRIALVL